jgi:hypothetical protein
VIPTEGGFAFLHAPLLRLHAFLTSRASPAFIHLPRRWSKRDISTQGLECSRLSIPVAVSGARLPLNRIEALWLGVVVSSEKAVALNPCSVHRGPAEASGVHSQSTISTSISTLEIPAGCEPQSEKLVLLRTVVPPCPVSS